MTKLNWLERKTAERTGFYSSILVDAIESGAVGGWAYVRNYEWKDQDNGTNYIIASAEFVPEDPEYVKAPMQQVFKWAIDEEDVGDLIKEKRVYVDHTLIRRGLNKVLSGEVKASDWIVKACKEARKDYDAGLIDAVCANVILQAGVFEENIYG
jgi:hypothetical protein|tara:strand:+ start:2731 stop:3192 length:462 start_codon:yes stop_codon:yes gene_type:complete